MPTSNNIAIHIEHLSKAYKLYDKSIDRMKESLHPFRKKYHHTFYALKDISFEVKKGETIGIIGKNGSGKSTLLKIISGVLTPTSGIVHITGKVSSLLELGTGFNPELTGIENVYFNGVIMGYSREVIETKIDDILSFADIGEFAYQPVKTYSSGMFVRLAFSVAINVDPEVLIVDEALSVGDIAFQAKCYKKFNQFRDSGKTILFVTHALDTVLRYCHRAIVLHGGAKIEEGTPKVIVDLYKRILSNSYSFNDDKTPKCTPTEVSSRDQIIWKNRLSPNQKVLEYGNGLAKIVDYGIFNSRGDLISSVSNDETATIKMRVKFNELLQDPIFAFSIKDIKGTELVGSNTFIEQIDTGIFHQGDEIIITFSQIFRLQVGHYSLSLGCTKWESDGLTVFHRLYDVFFFEVTASKGIFGMFDINSSVEITRLD